MAPALLNLHMELVKHFKEYWSAWKHEPKERGKLLLGYLIFPRATHRWLSYLSNHAPLRMLAWEFPQLATRIYRPYALRMLNCRERVAHMIEHHDTLHQMGWSRLTHLSCAQPIEILQWVPRDGDALTLQLLSLRDGHREGEASLQLLWKDVCLFSLTFLVRKRMGSHHLLVTRFQGSASPVATELIRHATKALHGLRPADLLIQTVQQLGKILGCSEVFFVSNRHRVALNPMRRLRIKMDLDRIWQERGAQSTPDGLFVLPAQVTIRTDFTDLPSNKRAQAKRKADTLRQILNIFNEKFQELLIL